MLQFTYVGSLFGPCFRHRWKFSHAPNVAEFKLVKSTMPIKPCPYFDPNEPSDDAEVRRYLTMFKFQKLMANEELYFARPDGFEDNDSAEGIPSRERVAALSGVSPYYLKNERLYR